MIRKYFIALICIMAIISCSNNKAKNRSSKELFINAGEEPKTIDPTLSGNDFVYPRHTFETLIIKGKDGGLKKRSSRKFNNIRRRIKIYF